MHNPCPPPPDWRGAGGVEMLTILAPSLLCGTSSSSIFMSHGRLDCEPMSMSRSPNKSCSGSETLSFSRSNDDLPKVNTERHLKVHRRLLGVSFGIGRWVEHRAQPGLSLSGRWQRRFCGGDSDSGGRWCERWRGR